MLDFAHARRRMVEMQLARRGLSDARVLDAMRTVAREEFVDESLKAFAYEDCALPVGHGQTISQPYIVALMAEKAEIAPENTVLEIGTGTGYAAAVISLLARRVHTVERIAALVEEAEERFKRLGYDNIEVRVGDGTNGWAQAAPFDAILVTAGGPSIPQALKQQLIVGGHLIMPVGSAAWQRLLRVTRTAADSYEETDLGAVRFVPLIGKHAWLSWRRDRSDPPD